MLKNTLACRGSEREASLPSWLLLPNALCRSNRLPRLNLLPGWQRDPTDLPEGKRKVYRGSSGTSAANATGVFQHFAIRHFATGTARLGVVLPGQVGLAFSVPLWNHVTIWYPNLWAMHREWSGQHRHQ